uniref:stAR-related lipid transfer protein 3-like n=1 Tax=Styela clava TaxID=7725 RepID=UPI00193A8F44|nr:stAR-related lipid transfer protein 3-like [Styela clava]
MKSHTPPKEDQKPLLGAEQTVDFQDETIPPNSPITNLTNNFQNDSFESEKAESNEKLDQFFDSYIDSTSQENTRESHVCSDSVSKCGDEQHSTSAPKSTRINSYLPVANNQIPESLFHQLQSDSSSLATLVTEKRISDSRRTFCLFVLFDLILTSLLWLLMCGTSANSEYTFFVIVGKQISEYTVNDSLFDVVCLAFLRFTFLELMYAVLRIKHWWPVALSTSVTDILLILKIFPIFQASGTATYLSRAIPMTIVILLTNFILSWIEVWLIDFKVLPAEAKLAQRTVRQFIQNQQSLSYGGNDADLGERAPLLNGHQRGFTPPQSYYTGATSDHLSYHSVLESEFERPTSRLAQLHKARPISREEQMHIEKGKGALNQLWCMFRNEEIWKLDKELENGDKLYTADIPSYGKTFRIDTTVYGVSAQQIFQEIILKAETMPTWNKAVDDVKILRRIGEQTAISLEVSKPAGKGLIQSRDFITVRRVDKIENMYISAGVSTEYEIPETGRIRGVNGPTGFIVEPLNVGYNSCKFTWILNTNLKGSLPQYLVNSNLAATMITFVSSMKEFLGAE